VARPLALPRPPAELTAAIARFAPVALLGAAIALLVAAELSTLREIKAVTVVPEGGLTKGGDHHGYALAVIAVAAAVMGFGAIRGGSRPAALAIAVLGAAALAIVLLVDYPSLDDTGLIGRNYDLAEAHPSTGFWLELAGAVTLLASGLVLLRRNAVPARDRSGAREGRRPARADADHEPGDRPTRGRVRES
jgi:hypothetical protein